MSKAPSTRNLIVAAARAGAPDSTLTSLVDLHIAEQRRRAEPFRPPLIVPLWEGMVAVVIQLGAIARRVGLGLARSLSGR